MSNSVWPHRRQPTRLPRPWDSLGKNTGVGCHFLLQCMKVKMKVKSLICVWLLATPWIAAYHAPLSMGFSRQEYWSGVPYLPLNCLKEFRGRVWSRKIAITGGNQEHVGCLESWGKPSRASLFKVLSLSLSARHRKHWLTSIGSCCLAVNCLPPLLNSRPLLPSSYFRIWHLSLNCSTFREPLTILFWAPICM